MFFLSRLKKKLKLKFKKNNNNDQMNIKNLLFESIGTFLVVLTAGMMENAILDNKTRDPIFSHGIIAFITYTSLFTIGKNISGCHLNPAVSFAMAFTKSFSFVEAIGYIIAQFTSGILGSLIYFAYKNNIETDEESIKIGVTEFFGMEIISSAFIVMVYLKILNHSHMIPEYLSSVLIGSAYFIVTTATDMFTDCGVNPAKTLPLNFVKGEFASTAQYLFAPFIGAVVGAFLFMLLDKSLVKVEEGEKGNAMIGAEEREDERVGTVLKDVKEDDGEKIIRED